MTDFIRGSEWHRWDYHVHTPASFQYNDRSTDAFDKLAAAIEKSDCSAFGINDYATLNGYLRLRGKVSKPIFPVVEFRMKNVLSDREGAGPSLNFHIFFTNEDAYLAQVQSFLNALTFHDYKGVERSLTESEVIDFARTQLAEKCKDETEQEAFYRIGLSAVRVDFEHILRKLEERQLREKSLIILPFDEYGGADHIMSKPEQDGLVKTGLIRNADILGSSADVYRQYFSGPSEKCPKDKFELWFGRPKPIIKGSDAHDTTSIGILPRKKDGPELHCWIKSDLTFDGFKQIIYEPLERISISTAPPHPKDQSRVIDSLVIRQAQGWFEDQEIRLNSDLVTIIGGKGSGKTALVDLIAFCGGETDAHKQSFIFKAHKGLIGTKLLLKWRNGLSDGEVEIAKILTPSAQSKVRYLSQSFVEALCSYEHHDKLEHEIENILFQYIPATEKLGAESFSSLKDMRVQGVQIEMQALATQIDQLNGEIFALQSQLMSRGELIKQRDDIDKEITELHRNKPKAANEEERKAADELKGLMDAKKKLEEEIEAFEIKINKLNLIKTKVQMMREQVRRYNLEVATALSAIGQSDLLQSITTQLPDGAEAIIDTRIAELTRNVRLLNGDSKIAAATDAKPTLADINKKVEAINQQCAMESEKQKELAKFNGLIAEKEQLRKALEQKVAIIDRDASRFIDEKRGERRELFVEFFKKLEGKRQILDELYQPLNQQALMMEEGRKIEFYARPRFDQELFVQRAEALFHGNKSVVRGREGFLKIAEAHWERLGAILPPTDDGAITSLLAEIQGDGEGRKAKPIRDQLRQGKTEKDVDDWLYSASYYDVEYGIKYDETDLDKLSPGKKGVVLLLIYLTVDKDSRPIIVDQPEENLDNRSVYSTLVKFFRKAKHHRQIIVVTHNPNLVVNGDSEQVIVANFDRTTTSQPARIRYVSGSIENSRPVDKTKANILDTQGIREHVCEILEGGKDAFVAREQKYGFQHGDRGT